MKCEVIKENISARKDQRVTSRYLALPRVTSRYLALPRVTSRYLALPRVLSTQFLLLDLEKKLDL